VAVFVFCLCRKKKYEEKKIDKNFNDDDDDKKSKVNFIPEVSFFLLFSIFIEQFIFCYQTEFN